MKQIIPLLDLTLLKEKCDINDIDQLCDKAFTKFGYVAAICIYQQYIYHVRQKLNNTPIKIATVINFPNGDNNLLSCLKEIETAKNAGANEIDFVMPYQKIIAGDQSDEIYEFLHTCCQAASPCLFKTICETGVLQNPQWIRQAAEIAIAAGSHFLKTSTGKTQIGTTLDAVKILLQTIREFPSPYPHHVGIKISGGIRTLEQATLYLDLIETLMGDDYVCPKNVRFGVSRLFWE